MREFSCLWYFCSQSKTPKKSGHCKYAKSKEKNLISREIRFFLSGVDRKDAGAKSCVARVCGLLRLDFPFCNSNPQHLVMTDE